MSQNYPCNHINVLSALEGIRMRPGMYIGPLNQASPLKLLLGVLAHPRSLAQDGTVGSISIFLKEDNQVEVQYGAALPMGERDEGRTLGELWFEEVVQNDPCNHGFLVANVLSETLTFTTVFDNKRYSKSYRRGEPLDLSIVDGADVPPNTTITFKPDPTIFASDQISFEAVMGLLTGITDVQCIILVSEDRAIDWENGALDLVNSRRGAPTT